MIRILRMCVMESVSIASQGHEMTFYLIVVAASKSEEDADLLIYLGFLFILGSSPFQYSLAQS